MLRADVYSLSEQRRVLLEMAQLQMTFSDLLIVMGIAKKFQQMTADFDRHLSEAHYEDPLKKNVLSNETWD